VMVLKVPFKSIVIFSVLSFVVGLSVGMFVTYPLHFQAYLRENYGVGSLSELNRILSPHLQLREAYGVNELVFLSSQAVLVALLVSTRFWKNDKHRLSRKILLIVIFVAFLGGCFSGDRVSLVSAQSATYVVSPEGAFVKDFSYLVYSLNGNAYAVNGLYGTVSYKGVDASAVIHQALNATQEGTVFIKSGYYNLSETLKISSKSLVCEHGTVFNWDNPGAAIDIDGDGVYLKLHILQSPTGNGEYGIRDLGVGTSYIDIYRLYNFKEAAIWFDAANATGNRANSYWNIRWIACAGHTKYGIKLDSASGVQKEGDKFDIGTIMHPTVRGILIGSDVNYQTHKWHVFNVDIDSAGYTEVLVEVKNGRNIINFEGHDPATQPYDVLVHPEAEYTKITSTFTPGPRVLMRNLRTYVDWDQINRVCRLMSMFESLDGFNIDTTGSGDVSLSSSLPNTVTHSTGTTADSYAVLQKRPYRPECEISFDQQQGFKTKVTFSSNTNQIVWIIVGDRGSAHHYGFKIVDDTIYGSVGNGSAETLTDALATISAGETVSLAALFYPGVEVSFFVNGEYKGILATGLPSGGGPSERIVSVHLTNTAAEDKSVSYGAWEYWILRS